MAERKAISKKLRFEVFKRDSFTCQYCGAKSPDVILHVDHIKPVFEGGDNEMLNLITSCAGCNLGKGKRELSDATVIDKQREQLEDLQERREQIEMMFDWQKSLLDLEEYQTELAAEYWTQLSSGKRSMTDVGKRDIKKLIIKHGFREVMEAMKISVNQYVKYENGNPINETFHTAFDKISGILVVRSQSGDNKEVYYIRGILRKRVYVNEGYVIPIIRNAINAGVPTEYIKNMAIDCHSWSEWKESVEMATMLAENNNGK